MSTYGWEHLTEIGIDILIDGREISRIAAVGITAVKKDKSCTGVCFDDRLHVGRRGQCKDEVRITQTSVELNWARVLFRSDAVWLRVNISEHSPGLLASVAMDNAVRTTKSLSALSAKRNTFDPPARFFHQETVARILLSTPEKSSGSTLMLSPVR